MRGTRLRYIAVSSHRHLRRKSRAIGRNYMIEAELREWYENLCNRTMVAEEFAFCAPRKTTKESFRNARLIQSSVFCSDLTTASGLWTIHSLDSLFELRYRVLISTFQTTTSFYFATFEKEERHHAFTASRDCCRTRLSRESRLKVRF